MRLLFALILLFLLLPLLELLLLIEVGSRIGALVTVMLCLLTALIGGALVRAQGLSLVRTLLRQLRRGRLPVVAAFHAICLLLAGMLLVVPGFVTDSLGFLLLLPRVRARLYEALRRRIAIDFGPKPVAASQPAVIAAEYSVITDDRLPPTGGFRQR